MDPPAKNYTLCGLKVQKDPATGEIKILAGTVKETPSCGGGGVSPGGSPSGGPGGPSSAGAGAGGAGSGPSGASGMPPPPGSGSSRTKTGTTLSNDPRTKKYFILISAGIPIDQIKVNKKDQLKTEGIHPSWLNEKPDRELYTDDDLSMPTAGAGAGATASASASASVGTPIDTATIENITKLFDTSEKIKYFQDNIKDFNTTVSAEYRTLKKVLTELQVEMNKKPRPSNYNDVQKMIDDNIKQIIQPSLDILNNFSTGTTLSSSDISNAQNNIKNIENLKGFLSSFISQTFNKELNTEIIRVKKLFPSAKPLGDITTKEDFNKALRDNDPRFYITTPRGIITGVKMNEIKNTYNRIYGVELDKTNLETLVNDAKIKQVQKKFFIFSGGRRNMRRSTRKYRFNNRNTRRSKH